MGDIENVCEVLRMTNQIATRPSSQVKSHKEHIEDVRTTFKKMIGPLASVIPRGASIERLIGIALTACQNKPELLTCDRRSLLAAIIESIHLNLELNPIMGQAYLVPRKGKVVLTPGYKGLLDLARRSDMVLSVGVGAVYAGDDFEFSDGTAPFIRHKKSLEKGTDLLWAWSRAEIRGAVHPSMSVLPKWFVEDIRARSAMKDSGPWKTDYAAMAIKTSVKQLSKVLPASVELRRAVALDDQAEIGENQNLESVLTPDGSDPMDVPPEE